MSGDDKDELRLQLSGGRHRASVISQLVDIGHKRNQLEHAKFRSFVRELQCLQLEGTQLHRRSINAYHEEQYVALSYTWVSSEHEDEEAGKYTVENWDDNFFQRSEVRNCVLDRVRLYMNHVNVHLLWIDAHCIRQETCGVGNCTHHSRCAQKRHAIQAMDLVYKFSEHPVALLGRPLKTESELHLFGRLLSGHVVRDDGDGNDRFRLSAASDIREAREALYLICEITRDRWCERAWTFQENYRGRLRMQLLIRHDPSLEPQKLQYEVFGEIPGELCVSSVTFSEKTTQLCLMLREVTALQPPGNTQRIDERRRIKGVLQAAGSYKLMLNKSNSMTPTVVADIEARKLEEPWDLLAIVANCCQYPVRLDGDSLRQQYRSPSLPVLAMCLLNGEILDNSKRHITSATRLTTSEFLKKRLFQGFSAPEDEKWRLTFIKGCRLTDVELTADGIATEGLVWKLGRIIDTSKFCRKLPWIDEPNGRLMLKQRRLLLQLAEHIRGLGNYPITEEIGEYLATDAAAGEDYESFAEKYIGCMAAELAAAIQRRQKLRLGAIWDPRGRYSPHRAIFVWPDEEDGGGRPSDFVFTSVWQGDLGSQRHDANDLDRYVTLNVECEEKSGIPRLRVRRSLHGLYFFGGCSLRRVIFPWPQEVQMVKP